MTVFPSRRVFWLISWLGVCGAIGCSRLQTDSETNTDAATAANIPLRLAMVGTEAEAQALQRAWLAVSEQPLRVTALADADTPHMADVFGDGEISKRHDLLLFAARETGNLQVASQLRRVQIDSARSAADDAMTEATPVPIALESGISQYAGQRIGVALGSAHPVLLRHDSASELGGIPDWEAYGQAVAALPAGKSAEPLADGWAVWALLHRANGYSGSQWLFSGDLMRPLLPTAPYLRALQELQRDARRYPETRMTPSQVWQAAAAAELELAIAWPQFTQDIVAQTSVEVDMIPQASQVFQPRDGSWQTVDPQYRRDWVLLMGDEPIVSLARGCRQTAASEQFLRWLERGEAASALALVSPRFVGSHDMEVPYAATDKTLQVYDRLLRQALRSSFGRTVMRLPGARDYLAVLDREVVAVLAGDRTAEEALVAAAEQWEEITESLGRRQQATHWRLAQGMSH